MRNISNISHTFILKCQTSESRATIQFLIRMLSNSTRSLRKVTHVPLVVPEDNSGRGHAVVKAGYVRQLALQAGEVDQVLQSQSRVHETSLLNEEERPKHPKNSSLWPLLRQFEGSPLASMLPPAGAFTEIPSSEITAFGNALVKVREKRMKEMKEQARQEENRGEFTENAEDIETFALTASGHLADLVNLVNTSVAATNAFNANTGVSPIGMLNLERLEMTPAGIEQGELLATIPLAPKEKTNVVQQEWSVISQEFQTIVTDSLENFSKTGVTENSELAQATASQNSHSNQFNVTASASGGCGFVSGSLATSFGSQGAESNSANDSRKHAVNTTKEASSRVIQSRKVTISTTSTAGSSETTTRMLENPSATDPMRVDYFSMMRRWHVGLYRYGLRQTYDITIPEPGAAMRAVFKELDELKASLGKQFSFTMPYSDITEDTYEELCRKAGAQIPYRPLEKRTQISVGGPIEKHGTDGTGDIFANQVAINIPDGYQVDSVSLVLVLGFIGGSRRFDVLGSVTNTWIVGTESTKHFDTLIGYNRLPFLQGRTGAQTITTVSGGFRDGTYQFDISLKRTDDYEKGWQSSIWNALYDAAQAGYYADQAKMQTKMAALQEQIMGIDTLTLRREENDEIMKCVLRWILGTNFEFVPEAVRKLYEGDPAHSIPPLGGDLEYGVNFTGNSIDPNKSALPWSVLYRYEAMVNFINQAIEWENVVFFLYSYFWDIPQSWKFIRKIQHPDATRQAFLRAGSARVVLTVRKGYEAAFTWFAENGDLNAPPVIPVGHPYMTIAQQIQNYDKTNYPGIPPANSNGQTLNTDDIPNAGTTSRTSIRPGATPTTPVTIVVDDSRGFVVGGYAIIDAWDAGISQANSVGIQERSMITAVPDAKSIVVQGLRYPHGGGDRDYPILQTSAKGLLIAEWYEYTPSKGTLIAVNSRLDGMDVKK